MDWVPVLRWLHVIGAAVLLGTGAGIAFFMVMARRTGSPSAVAHVADTVVLADFLFTASAVVAQPLTGAALAHLRGWSLGEGWLVISLALYLLTGAFWLPVVAMQMRLRRLARSAANAGAERLPAEFDRLYRTWFVCGFPAFAAVLAIIWLMLTRPHIAMPWS